MSGRTRSTPRCSSRGNARPASTTTTLAAVLVDGHVLADLAEAAQRDDARGSRGGCMRGARLDRGGLKQARAVRGSRARGRARRAVASTSGSRWPPTSWPSRFSAALIAIGLPTTCAAARSTGASSSVESPARASCSPALQSADHAPSPAGRRRACGRRCRRRRRARGTAGSGRRRPRRGRGPISTMCSPASRSSYACLTARTFSISASRAIVSGSMLITTRLGML